MAWNNQGGPWGGGSGNGGSSGGGSGGQGGGQTPWGRNPNSGGKGPDFDELLRRGQNRIRTIFPGGIGGLPAIAALIGFALLLWLASGFYRVNPSEVGVELVFGKFRSPVTTSGLHWNVPAPFGSVVKPDINTRNRVEIGFRSNLGNGGDVDVSEESLMLTGDENIVDIQAVVLWRIDNVEKYLFDIRDPDSDIGDIDRGAKDLTVKNAVEAAIREIIGQSVFEYAITEGRSQIEAKAEKLAQSILDSYNSGIHIEQLSMQKADAPQEVIDAFRDVQKAKADKVSLVNEAQAYFNQVTQDAEGQAAQMVRQSEGYKQEKIANAQGDVQRFLSIYDQYKLNPAITERRLYLETMERVMGGMNKVLVTGDGKGGAIPFLSLDQILKNQAKSGGSASQAAGTQNGTTQQQQGAQQ
ncbi:MAG TPA: FtsH protease activity modulator HflK [Dongiaceae bacterium]|nr:FtsH protease activity modulator HflK [Dongiaceae bacterium]